MASAQVMAMPVDTATGKERRQPAAAGDTGAQDVYIKLKSLQKHMEFLDIQVGARVWKGQAVRLGVGNTLFLPYISYADLSISVFFYFDTDGGGGANGLRVEVVQ